MILPLSLAVFKLLKFLLKTLIQIKRSSMDHVESELFCIEQIAQDKKIFGTMRICEMSPIFMNKLGLPVQDASNFARFLVEEAEEKPDQDPDKSLKIQYDPNRKANLQLVTVRLLLFIPFARIFTKEEEEKARSDFTKAFVGK